MLMSACVSVWQLKDRPAVASARRESCGAVMRLFEDDPEGYTKPLDTAFSVQIIVEELHYQHSAERLCAQCSTTCPAARAEPFIEQRDEGGSYDYYLKRGGGGGAEGGDDGAEE